MLQIRRVRADEWPAWRALRLRALGDAPDAFGATLAEALARPGASWPAFLGRDGVAAFVAERDGAWIGMVAAILDEDDAARAQLFQLWVDPAARAGGVGTALIAAACRWVRGRAALALHLRVADTATAAAALYERCGFRDTGVRQPVRDGAELQSRAMQLRLPPLIMGVVNVTPDSFSDGGRYAEPAAAIDHGRALLADGADILDIGGEATGPRAVAVPAAEELRRVLPVVEALAVAGATVSIDTTKAEVARAAVAAGASIVNDVSGGRFDPDLPAALAAIAGREVTYIAGHLRGASLAEVFAAEAPLGWDEVAAELAAQIAALPPAVRARTWADPGVGFGKGADPEANLALLRRAGDLGRALRRPIVVGPSRKRFLARIAGAPAGAAAGGRAGGGYAVDERALDAATVAACLGAARSGAQVLRAHNVALLRPALAVYTRL